MPELRLQIPYGIPTQVAISRLRDYIARHAERPEVRNLAQNWIDNRYDFSFIALGMAVDGFLQVNSDAVTVTVNLPLVALPFRPLLEREIREHLTTVLSPEAAPSTDQS